MVMLVVSSPTKALRSTLRVTVLGEVVLVLPAIGVTESQFTEGVAMLQFTNDPVSPVFLIWKVSCELDFPKSTVVTGTLIAASAVEAVRFTVTVCPPPTTRIEVETSPSNLVRSIMRFTFFVWLALMFPEVGETVSQFTEGVEMLHSNTEPSSPVFWI